MKIKDLPPIVDNLNLKCSLTAPWGTYRGYSTYRVGGAQKGRVEQCLCQDLHIVSNLYQPGKHISTTTSIQKLQQQMEGLTVNNSLKVSLKDSL